jgi:asparagine synthase (glutamine-hydrolysing)
VAKVTAAGLWGLARSDGGPVKRSDALGLGLALSNAERLAEGRDCQDPHLIDEVRDAAGHTILTGWIADPADLARTLGLPTTASSALVARAALAHFGGETPVEMLGEWSLYHSQTGGPLWLVQAATIRDRLFFAANGGRFGFAPDVAALGDLDWLGRTPDPEAFAMHLGRHRLRAGLGWRSILAGIEAIPPGGSVRLERDGSLHRHSCDILAPQQRFPGNLGEAREELESTLRAILRERLGMTRRAAILLSGGLDSSLLAGLAADERASPLFALCSVAPDSSGIPDEYGFANAVAQMHDIELVPACPAHDANPYRPASAVMAGANSPLISNRHCLTSRFQAVARESGASMLVNGTYGEMSVSARLSTGLGLRQRLGLLRRHFLSGRGGDGGPFHVCLARHRQEAFFRLQPDRAEPGGAAWQDSSLIGYLPGSEKALAHPNAFSPEALRMDFPFRDLRLLRLFASLPRELALGLGPDRGLARSVAAGILPKQVVERQSGMPADPAHMYRLQAFASSAHARIPAFRAVEADDWFDLDWLDTALVRVADRGPASVSDANRVQLTVLAAEYLHWLRAGEK